MIYEKNTITKLDTDWVTDFTLDFSQYFTKIATHQITADSGIDIIQSEIVALTPNIIKIRIAGGTKGSTYTVNCKVISTSGKVRDMDLNLLII